jgi:hypothetical protein
VTGILPEPKDHAERLEVARRVAAWHIGDDTWADMILEAYLDPDRAAEDLEAEQRD